MRLFLILILLSSLGCMQEVCEHDIDRHHYEDMRDYPNLDLMDYPEEGYRIKNIIVHCTASREGLDLSLAWFLDFFKYDRGWTRPGYHFLILLNGDVEVMWVNNLDPFLTIDEVVNGAFGYNTESIHIAYVGGVDRKLNPKDTRTQAQKESMESLIQRITCLIPNLKVFGHKQVSNKACPSFEASKEYEVYQIERLVNTTTLFDLHQTQEDTIISK